LRAFTEKTVGCQAAFASKLAPTEKQKAKAIRLLLFTTQYNERKLEWLLIWSPSAG